jgi:hypothetical protein
VIRIKDNLVMPIDNLCRLSLLLVGTLENIHHNQTLYLTYMTYMCIHSYLLCPHFHSMVYMLQILNSIHRNKTHNSHLFGNPYNQIESLLHLPNCQNNTCK